LPAPAKPAPPLLIELRRAYAQWRDRLGDALEELAVGVTEGGRLVRVDVDLADNTALPRDGDHDLRAGRRKAREVARIGVDVVNDLGLPARGRGAAHALADRDAHVFCRLRALP